MSGQKAEYIDRYGSTQHSTFLPRLHPTKHNRTNEENKFQQVTSVDDMWAHLLVPWDLVTKVFPICLIRNMDGAFTSYHSFFEKGSTLQWQRIDEWIQWIDLGTEVQYDTVFFTFHLSIDPQPTHHLLLSLATAPISSQYYSSASNCLHILVRSPVRVVIVPWQSQTHHLAMPLSCSYSSGSILIHLHNMVSYKT